MPNQFLSDQFGDIEDYFLTDYQFIDQYIGDTLWSFGLNTYGQLGNNDTISRSTPVTTLLGGTNWKSVAAGTDGAAGIKTDGSLWTWGNNFQGELGIGVFGLTTERSTPVTTLVGGTNWKSIACGQNQVAAIKTDGTLWTWGNGNLGQLGNNSLLIKVTPVTTLIGGTNWRSVSLSLSTVAAIKTDGTLWVWGNNVSGQLGLNDLLNRSTPVTTLLGGNDWKQVAAGHFHIAAVKNNGTLWNWGNNLYGQLGVYDNVHRSTPVTTVLGGTNWKFASTGRRHTMAIKTDGTLWGWGRADLGNLGTNDQINRSTPVTTFLGGTDWKHVANSYQTMAIKTDGSLWCWGYNVQGQTGVNNNTSRLTPVTTILGGNNWKTVACGYFHTVALTAGLSVNFN